MSERIKKNLDLVTVLSIGTIIAVTALIGIVGWPTPVFSDITTTVAITATVNEWLTFTVSNTSVTLSPELVDTVGGTHIGSSTDLTFTLGTNSDNGYSMTIGDNNNGLKSGANLIQLSAASTSITNGVDGFGVQATSTMMTVRSQFAFGTSTDWVGRVASSTVSLATNGSPGTAQLMYMKVKASCDNLQPNGSYTDTLYITATPSP